MATLNLFPARVRFVNDDGTLTPEAYRTLQVLSQRVGGPLGDNGRDVFGDLTGVAALDLSIMDTVTQQPATEQALADVVQPPNEAVPFDLAAAINAATSKATPVDADVLPLADSASGFTLKKLAWANLKAAIKTYLSGVSFPIGVAAPAVGSFTALDASGVTTLSYQARITALGGAHRLLMGNQNSGGTNKPVIIQSVNGEMSIGTGDTWTGNGGSLTPILSITSSGLSISGVLATTGGAYFHSTSTPLTNGAGAGAGTISNAPTAGNPTKWIGINDNGTIRYIPSW